MDAYENLTAAWPSWSPTWTATSVNPNLGNGTLIGAYRQVGKTIDTYIRLIWGSTTTGGTGTWLFTLPVTNLSFGTDALYAFAEDASASFDYPVAVRLQSSTPNVVRLGAHTSTGAIGTISGTHPFTWAVSDVLLIKGTYTLS
jgi:hypothetical protein